MRQRLWALSWLLCLSLAVAVLAPPRSAAAFTLEEAQRDGLLVREALALGAGGDWASAEALVAGADLLVRDIVLWRKLRAGQGTPEEYEAYIARRSTWPGGEILRRVVRGRAPRASDLTGPAAENYALFRRTLRSRDYPAAEALLIEYSANPAGLGEPSVWADERLSLARRAAREGRWQNAYLMAAQHYLTPAVGYDYSDAEWVAGWVALRKLNDPARAITHFRSFRDSVETPISLGRGGYWLGRAYEAAGNEVQARRWYQDAAQYQTSFYGQLAAAAIGAPGNQQLTTQTLPDWRGHPSLDSDDVRLGATLFFAGEDRLAMATFSRLGERLPAGALAPLARLVLEIGQPHYAVRIAKKAARRGVLIYPAYYPLHDLARYTTKVEPAFAMSVARQETELNPRAISRAGARGLMQLMPATARRVSGWIGEAYCASCLLDDWRYNARLGETYLSRRTEQFWGSYVMAAAAYNAGAGRVDQWIAEYGDPRTGEIDIIDWMEQIPFNETRNYVQRVMEGLYVYRTRLSRKAGPMTIVQDLNRGIRR